MAIELYKQDTGSTVFQVTEDSLTKSNIYCEIPYCSADSRYFVFTRSHANGNRKRKMDFFGRIDKSVSLLVTDAEYVICELGSWDMHLGGRGCGGIAMSHSGIFFFLRLTDEHTMELVRLDLANGESEVACAFPEPIISRTLATVSPDERFYAYGVVTDEKYREYGVEIADLMTGSTRIIDRDPYILNPHPQFEPSEGKQIMVQHNRGGKIDENGNRMQLVGEEGATIYLLDIESHKRTPLQVGKPYTAPCTGHETWIGGTKEMILTVSASGDQSVGKGNLLGVRSGEPARVISTGHTYAHVGASVCGRFFCCDEFTTGDIVIGSIKTGKNAVVCHSESSLIPGQQNTHPHPYLTPDLNWVIFNSDRSGEPQIHAATVPDGMIEELERE